MTLGKSLLKTITWRIIGSTDTFIVSYLVTGTFEAAIKIGGIGLCTKMIMYFIHERLWNKSVEKKQSRLKSIIKTGTWRLVGSIDTFIISMFVLEDLSTAASIGGIGFLTKSLWYFMHERVWSKVNEKFNKKLKEKSKLEK